MKFTIERAALIKALAAVQGVVGRGTKGPAVLSHVLIEADMAGRVTFHANNLDMQATITAEAGVWASGSTCAPATLLAQIGANAADGSEINIDLGERLGVKSGRSWFNLSVLPAADFPTFSTFAADVEITLPANELAAIIGRPAFAKSADTSKFILTGVCFFGGGGKLGAVATDTHRLAITGREWEGADFGVIVPPTMVTEMIKLLDGSDPATISLSTSKIQLTVGDALITSKLISGPYVDFVRVIPSDFTRVVTVDGVALQSAIKRASIAADDNARACTLMIGDNIVQISASGQDATAGDKVDCEYDGPEMAFGVNSSDMAEALGAVHADIVRLSFTDRKAAPFSVTAEADGGLFQLVMPLRGS